MQLFSRNKAIAALSLGALAALGACGDDVTVPAPVNPPVAVAISPSNANVNVGAFVDLAVSITGGTATPTLATCSTSNAAVATVAVQGGNACRVTGVSTGSVSITAATSSGQTAAAAVTVAAPTPSISGIAISPAAQNLQVGGTFTITAEPTTRAPGAAVAKNFVSSNAAVATVNATTGVVTAVAPGQTTITVTLTGTGTGLTQAIVTGQVAVTVTALPPSVLGVTATPASAALITGGTQQITATGSYAEGISGTITYGTTDPGVATVNASGLITAVGPGQATITVTASSSGNASFAAASATQQIPVRVNMAPQVSIANITQGSGYLGLSIPAGPVDINNVFWQIQVELNLATNKNNVSTVSLYICDAGVNCVATAQPAAQQSFGNAGAADGKVTLFVNTADFTTDFATATPKYSNGQKNLIAVLGFDNSNANSNLAILNFNNQDGFVAKHTAPARSAVQVASNTTFHGGPGADGRGRVQIAPLFFTAGRSLSRATVGLSGVCDGTITFGGTGKPAFPIDYTYGYTLATDDDDEDATPDATNIVCGAESDGALAPDVAPRVASSVDNAQNQGPTADDEAFFYFTNASMPAVKQPAVIRVDYKAPNVSYAFGAELEAPTNGELGWVNAAYDFAAATQTDAGVGPRKASTILYSYTGCGSKTYTAFTTNTGDDLAECESDFTGGLVDEDENDTRGPYKARATGQDLLSNEGTATTDNFGVDKTAPALRYTKSTDDKRIYNGVTDTLPAPNTAADTMFSAQALDERAGFTSTAAEHLLARSTQILNTGSCVVGTAPVATKGGIGSTFITAPNCTSPWAPAALNADALSDGYRQIASVTYNGLAGLYTPAATNIEGYWTYRVRVTDRAGNSTELADRYALINTSAPSMTGMGLPSVVKASGENAFTPNFTEIVESKLNSFKVSYGTWIGTFPAVATHTLWDNIIGANGNTTMGTPFTSGVTFYTNIQQTAVDGSIGDTTSLRPTKVWASVTNVGGNAAAAFFGVDLLDPNVEKDDVVWASGASSKKGAYVNKFEVVTSEGTTFFSPEGGLKARVTASTNLLNSPFSRVDFYYLTEPELRVQGIGAGEEWAYVGSVDATSAPATSAVAGRSVYIADNGTERVWTYVLRKSANTNMSLTETVLYTQDEDDEDVYTDDITTPLPGCYRAVATKGTSGRVLATQDFCTGDAVIRRR